MIGGGNSDSSQLGATIIYPKEYVVLTPTRYTFSYCYPYSSPKNILAYAFLFEFDDTGEVLTDIKLKRNSSTYIEYQQNKESTEGSSIVYTASGPSCDSSTPIEGTSNRGTPGYYVDCQ